MTDNASTPGVEAMPPSTEVAPGVGQTLEVAEAEVTGPDVTESDVVEVEVAEPEVVEVEVTEPEVVEVEVAEPEVVEVEVAEPEVVEVEVAEVEVTAAPAAPVPSPKMFASRPRSSVAAAAPHTPSDSARFGRVGEDGTVYVQDGEGERAVGSYPGASSGCPAELRAQI